MCIARQNMKHTRNTNGRKPLARNWNNIKSIVRQTCTTPVTRQLNELNRLKHAIMQVAPFVSICINMYPYVSICIRHASVCTHMIHMHPLHMPVAILETAVARKQKTVFRTPTSTRHRLVLRLQIGTHAKPHPSPINRLDTVLDVHARG